MALNLGGITFGLAADVTGLDRAASTLQAFGNRVTAVMAAAKRGADTNIQELMRQEAQAVRTLQQVQDKIAAIGRMNISPTVRTDQIDRLREAAEGFTRIMSGKLDALQFQRAGLGIRELLQDVDRALQAEKSTADTASNAVAAAFERQRLAIIRAEYQIDLYIDKLERAQRAGQISGSEASGLRIQAFNALQAHNAQVEPGATPLNAEAMLRANQSLRTSMTGLNRDFSALVQHQSFAASGFKALGNAATLSMGPLSGVSFRVQALNQLITDHGVLLGVGAAAVIGFATALFGLAQSVVHVTIEIQRTQMALQGITNSSALATAEISILRDVANQAGLRFSEIAPAFSRFVSSAVGAGQSLGTTNREFQQFAMLAGVLHLSTDEVNNSLRAFDQMLSAGRVQGQEVRQLFNNLPAVMEIATEAAQHLGMNLRDSMRSGTLSSQAFIREFMNVATTMFHIDLAHPIDTLQAAINRSKNSWDTFLLAVDRAVNISGLAKTGFNALSNILNSLSNNIQTIVIHLSAFAGAMLGAVAGFAAFAGLQAAIAAWPTVLMVINVAWQLITAGIWRAAAAQAVFNAATSSNFWIAIAQAIFTVVGALAGYTTAQRMAAQATAANAAALEDASQTSIEQYIAGQRRMLTATEDTTAAMIRQSQAQGAQAHQAAVEAANTLNTARDNFDRALAIRTWSRQAELTDPSGASSVSAVISEGLVRRYGSAVDSARESLNAAVERDLRIQANLRELQALATRQHGMPDSPAAATAAGSGTGRHADPMSGLRGLQDIIEKATEAQNALDNMWRGPANTSMYQALAKANEAVNQLDASHRELLGHMLQAAGFEVSALGGVSGAVFVLTARTQLATEMAQRFGQAWSTIHETVVNIADLNTQLDWLRHGGNPDDMWAIEALQRTQSLINELTGQSGSGGLPALRQALQGMVEAGAINAAQMQAVMDAGNTDNAAGLHALVDLLHSLNYGLTTTGTDAEIAAAGLDELFTSGARLNQQLRVTSQVLGDVRTRFREWANLQAQMTLGQNHGSIRQFRELEALQTSTEFFRRLRELGDTQTIDAITGMLNEQGFTVGTLEQRYAAFNMVVDDTQRSLDSYRQGLEQTQQSWTNFTNSTLDDIESLIMGTATLRDTVKAILMDLARTILETTLFDPIKRQLTNLIQGIPSAFGTVGSNGGGIWGSILGLFGGGGSAASSGGAKGIVDAIGFMSGFMGFAGGTDSAPGGWSWVGEKGPELMNVPKGAQIYPHGTGPGPSGGVYVNASTSVVVQGNLTPDAMEELKQVLTSREMRLRAELPYLIDGRVQDSISRGRYG